MGNLNYQLDLHGMTAAEAKKRLERLIADLPDKYGQITVIHGHRQGSSLCQMVRGKSLNPKRVRQKILTMNPGETILLLNTKERSKLL